MTTNNSWDYCIAGAGLAGLSLAARMAQHPDFRQKSILILDPRTERTNDRTWSFWETETGFFEALVHKKWEHIRFASDWIDRTMNIAPYVYKTIRGIDLYEYCLAQIAAAPNIELRHESVLSLTENEQGATVETEQTTYSAAYVFNSIPPDLRQIATQPNTYFLWQHFKGLVLKTQQPIFDPSIATFMDFRIDQGGETRFFYVLPYSTTEAMVEYTIFGEDFWESTDYDPEIERYLREELGLSAEDYTVEHEEVGKIPMTDYAFPKPKKSARIIPIGTTGGRVKASSGYAFMRIQQESDSIVKLLLKGKAPIVRKPILQQRFDFYDSVLFNTMVTDKVSAARTFSLLFKRNKPSRVLRFLDEKTWFPEDYYLINTTPILKFMGAAAEELARKF